LSDPPTPPNAEYQRQNKEHNENKEENFGDAGRCHRDAGEPENSSQNRYDKEYERPVKHCFLSFVFSKKRSVWVDYLTFKRLLTLGASFQPVKYQKVAQTFTFLLEFNNGVLIVNGGQNGGIAQGLNPTQQVDML